MRHRILLLALSAFLLGRVHAQDPHFTQAHRLPAWYNPAAVGASAESLRISALYRNQWASVTSPFRTEAFFAEKCVQQHGLGFNLVNNHAGSTGFRQLYAGGQWSISKKLSKNLLSTGLHLGVLQRSFDPSSMTFDEQYSPDQGSAAAIPHTENFTAMNSLRPDAGLGILWRYAGDGSERFTPFAGVGATHLNKPRETYILEESAVEPRYTVQAGTGYRISETVSLASLLQFSKQAVSRELMASIRGQIKLNETSDLEGLLLFRNADALALGVAYRWTQYSIGMSYDVNISGITRTPGGAEIMLVYTPEIRTRAKRERKTVEMKTETVTEPMASVVAENKPTVAEFSPDTSARAEEPVVVETSRSAHKPENPILVVETTEPATPLGEAIATILPSIGNRNDSSLIPPSLHGNYTPDLAAILAAFNSGSEPQTITETGTTLPVHQSPPTNELMHALPIPPLGTVSIIKPDVVRPTAYSGRTSLPIAEQEQAVSKLGETQELTVLPGAPHSDAMVINTPNEVDFDRWIGFDRGSSNVHGLYKLDVIEPALDLLLNDSALSLELSMPESEGYSLRKGIVKEIFVTKGLEPARIRILPEPQNGSTNSSTTQAGAVRVRILRAR